MSIKFTRTLTESGNYRDHPAVQLIRLEARAKGWAGMAGFKEYCKEEYNATLRCGNDSNWTSIVFKDSVNLNRFTEKLRKMGVTCLSSC